MHSARKPLSRPDDLVAAGLLPPQRLGAVGEIAKRYALALTADVAELIDRADPRDPPIEVVTADLSYLSLSMRSHSSVA